jgi:hypothetical protein
MPIALHRPWLLLAVLGLILSVGIAASALAGGVLSDDDGEFLLIPDSEPTGTVDPDDYESAVEVARESELVRAITGSQEWTVSEGYPATVLGRARAVTFDISFNSTVSSDGPWTLLKCRGTRMITVRAPWTDVSSLRLTVDAETAELIGLAVTPPPSTLATSGDRYPKLLVVADETVEADVTDLRTGAIEHLAAVRIDDNICGLDNNDD